MTLDSPAELDLGGRTEVVVTFFSYSQYPFTGEVAEGVTDCTEKDTIVSDIHSKINMKAAITMAITSAQIITRSVYTFSYWAIASFLHLPNNTEY